MIEILTWYSLTFPLLLTTVVVLDRMRVMGYKKEVKLLREQQSDYRGLIENFEKQRINHELIIKNLEAQLLKNSTSWSVTDKEAERIANIMREE